MNYRQAAIGMPAYTFPLLRLCVVSRAVGPFVRTMPTC